MSAPQKDDGPQLTQEELRVRFLGWVEAMLHDIESVPDEEGVRFWCSKWWEHPEAVARLSALHTGYIQAVADDQLSQWWIHQWDAHARVLFGPTGPFEACRYGKHFFFEKNENYTPRLVTEYPPTEWNP